MTALQHRVVAHGFPAGYLRAARKAHFSKATIAAQHDAFIRLNPKTAALSIAGLLATPSTPTGFLVLASALRGYAGLSSLVASAKLH